MGMHLSEPRRHVCLDGLGEKGREAGLHLWLELGPAFKNGWSWAWLSWMAGDGPACKDGWKWAQLLVMAAVKPGFHGWLEVAWLAWMAEGLRNFQGCLEVGQYEGWLKKGPACIAFMDS